MEVAGSVIWGGDGVIPNQNALDCKFVQIWMSSVAMGVAIIAISLDGSPMLLGQGY